jgi:hypothetical protein
MSREYVINMSTATVTSTNTLVAFCPSANSPTIEVMRAWLSQRYGATSGQQGVALVMQWAGATANYVVGLSTGQITSPTLTKAGDPVSYYYGSTVCGPTTGTGTTGSVTLNCTSDGTGVKNIIISDNFNVLNGWLWVPTPAETHMLGARASTQSYGLYLPVTPATLTLWTAGLSYRELG